MSRAPFFSVVIDNYNYGRFLPQTVDARMRALFAERLEAWLAKNAKSLSPRHAQRLRLEDLRRRVLLAALSPTLYLWAYSCYARAGANDIFNRLNEITFEVTLVTSDNSNVRQMALLQKDRFPNPHFIDIAGPSHFLPQEVPQTILDIALSRLT